MKSNVFLLLKTNLSNIYKIKTATKKKKILFGVLVLYLVPYLFITLYFLLNAIFKTLYKVGATDYFIPLLFVLASIFAFFFSIFSAKGTLFDSKDNDLLLSLPIKKSEILTSRLLVIAMFNLMLGLLFILPGIYIYITKFSLSAIQIISILCLLIFFCIIPSVLSSLFGYIVAKLTSKSKHKNMFELISYCLFIGLYMLATSYGNKVLSLFSNNIELLENILKYAFFPFYLINKALVTENILYVLLFAIVNIAVLLIFITFMKKSYFKIISDLKSFKTKSDFKMKNIHTKTIKQALRKKEIKQYFSSAIYVFNTLFGVILIVVAGIASLIYSPDKLIAMVDIAKRLSQLKLVLCLLLFVIVLTDTTNSSISIEKNNFWIMKMIPVKEKEIFNSKTFVNKIILIPITLVSLFLFFLSGYMNIYELLLLYVLTIALGSFIANYGLLVNLLLPKFDANNDTVIVKQSAASFAGIFGGLGVFLIFMLVIFLFNINTYIMLGLLTILSIILYVVSEMIVNTWGIKRFREIN